jgi:DNA-binding NarL/FixJ family response regulator
MDRREIARALKRSPQTISNSLTIAKEKLCARSLIEAAVVLSASGTG